MEKINKPFYTTFYDALKEKFPDLEKPEVRTKYKPDGRKNERKVNKQVS